jgi:hypothetical protein
MRQIKFPVFISVITSLIAHNLSGLTAGEVIKMPENISRQDSVPYWQRDKIYQHPANICNLAIGNDDQYTRKTKDDGQENKRDGCIQDPQG